MTVTIEEAQKSLAELLSKLTLGAELIITRDAQPVARVVPLNSTLIEPDKQRVPGSAKGILTSGHDSGGKLIQPTFGSCQGKLLIHADDDEHLEDFKEYM
jgi:antitoxin (DNA-binding transcriptional repressor) of toxin-antitoxin stability system